MILAANRNTRSFVKTVEQTVGPSFSLLERWRMGGVGSGKLIVYSASEALYKCFGKSRDIKFVIIELRKKGIIVHIRNAVNNYVWLIPFHHLSIFKSDLLSIHGAGQFIKIDLSCMHRNNIELLEKIMRMKAEMTGDRID